MSNIPITETFKPWSFEFIPSTEEIKYPYFFYMPSVGRDSEVTNVLLWGHGSYSKGDFDSQVEHMKDIEGGVPRAIKELCESKQIACLMPILPRTRIGGSNFDTQMLTRSTMLFDESCPEFYRRPDIEILKMLNQSKLKMSKTGHKIVDRIIVGGISAGGGLANRFSLLYPDIVKASAVLLAGDSYPEAEINGVRVGYPFGIADIEQIQGQRFSFAEFKRIKHFIFVGGKDNDPKNNSFSHDLDYDEILGKRLQPVLGANKVEMFERYVSRLTELGISVTTIKRDDLGHQVDDEIMSQLCGFIEGALGV